MVEEYSGQQFISDMNVRMRDSEEKQRLLRDRVMLLGQNLIEEREKNFKEIQMIKREVMVLKEDTRKMKETLQRIGEQVDGLAKKEDLMILQRQFDLFRKT